MAESEQVVNAETMTTPIFKDGRYKNPWSTWNEPEIARAISFGLLNPDKSAIPGKKKLDKTLPVLKPDMKQFRKSPESGIRHMWIGHASSLVQFDGITFLTDPIFSDRCAPTQWIGPKRYRPPPCSVADLPHVDCVVISHNHYDHLDHGSVKDLSARFGDGLRWYVPMGVKQWMNDCGCTNVVELTWWQEHLHSQESGIRFVSTPCQHWSGRGIFDKNKALWTSWCVLGPKHKFYFTGDSGYCDGFKQIGQKYGPFDLATIPIGASYPRHILAPQHVSPEQGLEIHKDIKSQQSIGIHWGTFKLSFEFYLEPKNIIQEELEKQGMLPNAFVTVAHGDIKVFGARGSTHSSLLGSVGDSTS